jgi:hypothetical protein
VQVKELKRRDAPTKERHAVDTFYFFLIFLNGEFCCLLAGVPANQDGPSSPAPALDMNLESRRARHSRSIITTPRRRQVKKSEEEAMLTRQRTSRKDPNFQTSGVDAPLPEATAPPAPAEVPRRAVDEIRRKTVDRVAYFKDVRSFFSFPCCPRIMFKPAQTSPELMTARLHNLDQEWTIQRVVMLLTGLMSAGAMLGGWWYGHHSFYLIPLVSSLVLFQTAITGWSPLVPPLRLLVQAP